MKIFVYGTLKRGEGNAWLMEKVGAQFIGADEAPGVVWGPFPFARPQPEGWIKGEVYEVDALALRELDCFEGHPHSYRREDVTLKSGLVAGIYYYTRDLAGRFGCYIEPEGNWSRKTARFEERL